MPPLAYDEKSIALVWEKPRVYAGIVDYRVYRDGALVGSVQQTATSPAKLYIDRFYADPANSRQVTAVLHNYTVTGLAPDMCYRFTVRSVDQSGHESADSNRVVQSTTAVPEVFNVVDFGAVGDGTTVNTAAIQAAIDACTRNGKVLIPAGVFVTGAIWLKSDMTLELAGGGTLRGSANADDYPYHYLLYDYSTDERFYSLINAHTYDYGGIANIRIVGAGTIDGNGWKQNGPDSEGFPVSSRSSSGTVMENGILARAQVQKATRLGSAAPYGTRSNLITLRGVRNVYYAGFTALNPSNHTLVNLHSENVTVNGVRLTTYDVNNADGIEFAHGTGLTVFNTVFDTGDDAMNFAAGLGAASAGEQSTRNAWIFNNYFREGHGAVVAGSHTGAWIENILAEDNVMDRTDVGLRMKTVPTNGGGARNVLFRDNALKDITNEAFIFTSEYLDAGAAIVVEPAAKESQFSDVTVRNVTVDGTGREAIKVVGTALTPHRRLHFDNVRFIRANPTSVRYLRDSSFSDVVFDATPDPWSVTDSTGLSFDGAGTPGTVVTDAAAAPSWPRASRVNAAVTAVSATLSWSAASDNVAVAYYRIFANGTLVGTAAGTERTYTVGGLSPALTYRFTVQAEDATGNRTSDGPRAVVTTTGVRDNAAPATPPEPGAFSLSDRGLGTTWAKLAWQPATDDYGVAAYQVYANGRPVGRVTGDQSSYPVTGLRPGTGYVLSLRALDATGNSARYGATVAVTTNPAYDLGVPTWPDHARLWVQAVTGTSVTLRWTPAADDQAVIGYRVFQDGRPLRTGNAFTPVNDEYTVAGTVHTVTGLSPGTAYTFAVQAGDSAFRWTGSGPTRTVRTIRTGQTGN